MSHPCHPQIRAEKETDIPAVYAVHAAAFPTPAEANLVDALRSAGRAVVSLVAQLDGVVVGHVLFSPVTVGVQQGLGLAPVAVLPAQQRRGIGERLIRAGLQEAVKRGFTFCVVLGEPGYYGRFGFQKASARGLENEYGVDEEFMVLELAPGALDIVRGLVRYSEEFQAV